MFAERLRHFPDQYNFQGSHMQSRTTLPCLVLTVLIFADLLHAQLSVQPLTSGSRPGYIDNALLVVEPHGSFVEQTLYLNYADHNAYPGNNNLEIVHRFSLPSKAVINDMRLWIRDTVMQAILLSTWSARKIYDSIVSSKRDPAFLSKSGELYEFHIYPLVSGSFRRIKMTFFAPANWSGNIGTADLPLRILKDNNATVKPLRILFKEREDIGSTPVLVERPLDVFVPFTDTAGKSYKALDVADISSLSSLSLQFATPFANGTFTSSSRKTGDDTYFQFGFVPGKLFSLPIDSSAKKILFGIDLGGAYSKNSTVLIPNLKQMIKTSTKLTDSIKIVVTGAGKKQYILDHWMPAFPDSVNSVLDQFALGGFATEVFKTRKPYIIFADGNSLINWKFTSLADFAASENYGSLPAAIANDGQADVIASMSSRTGTPSLALVDTFFQRGGRLLTYVDNNFVSPVSSSIALSYIPGLNVISWSGWSPTLYRNISGNIGMNFLESFVHPGFDYVFHYGYAQDSAVKVDLKEISGKPVVISKRVRNGLIIVSGIYSQKDDDATRKMIAVPLLGLNDIGQGSFQQLRQLLDEIRSSYLASKFDKAILVSNADSLFSKVDAETIAAEYLMGFTGSKPSFNSINLLDGLQFIPATLTVQSVSYYGSGYLMKAVADALQGSHFETHLDTWNTVCTALSPMSYPRADSLSVTATIDNGTGTLREIREIAPLPADPNKARFFIGSSSPAGTLGMRVKAQFHGIQQMKDTSVTAVLDTASASADSLVAEMLGSLQIQDKFNEGGKDTAGIVALALKHHLLTNYTALIALEPKDTITIKKEPGGGSSIVNYFSPNSFGDSLVVLSYPNPFNSQTNIVVKTKSASLVTVVIYNTLGQIVAIITENEPVQGMKIYSWNGRNGSNVALSSGVYFIHVIAREIDGGHILTQMRKILMLK